VKSPPALFLWKSGQNATALSFAHFSPKVMIPLGAPDRAILDE
jgi:hypothetical protein